MPKGTNMLETQTYHDPLDLSGSLWLEGRRGSGTADPGGLSDRPAGSAELGCEGVGNRRVSHPPEAARASFGLSSVQFPVTSCDSFHLSPSSLPILSPLLLQRPRRVLAANPALPVGGGRG